MSGFWLLAAASLPSVVALAAPERIVIPSTAFRPENGFCYIATFDCGEDGDKETSGQSHIIVYEDGQPLGPARARHADIREQGRGRYSHWSRDGLYLSASDNSDPRTNGRVYSIGTDNPDNLRFHPLEEKATPHEHVERITASQAAWTIAMGGTLDAENTFTQGHGYIQIAFQPNLELELANTGEVPVVNPRLVLNDRGNWFTLDDLLAEWTRGATTPQETALLLWQNMRTSTYHALPLYAHNEMHDPVRLFNIFGFNLCDDAGNAGATLFNAAGLTGSVNRSLNGHVMCEAMVDGRLQFLDVDQDCFYLDRENERPVSGDELAADHDLARRELNYGPVIGSYQPTDQIAGLFGPDDRLHAVDFRGHTLDYTLRPGERMRFRWDNVDKVPAQSDEWDQRPNYFGNSQLVYEPRLTPTALARDAAGQTGLVARDGQLVAEAADAEVRWAVQTPWLICGGQATVAVDGGGEPTRCAVEFSFDGQSWRTLAERTTAGPAEWTIPLDEALEVKRDPPKRTYQVRVTLTRPGARLTALRLETDLLAAPNALPRLRLGENRAAYTDQTVGPHELTITHRWRESSAIIPPAAPAAPESPAPGAVVAADQVTYRWAAVEGATRYHLQVSQRPDFAVPYRPGLDVIIPRTDWTVPFEGIYSPDVTYYWRLRSQNRSGVWSPWSETWTFTWSGPRVPVGVEATADGPQLTLHWHPNPRGPRPVAYEVYGSDVKGFSIAREPHKPYGLEEQPSNLLARTDDTALVVAGPGLTGDAVNKVFYRVVAIDANGTRSGCSDAAELPHPFIVTDPAPTATVGQPWQATLQSLASRGDLQARATPDKKSYVYRFTDGETITWSLIDGPAWLTLDPTTPALTGTPPAAGRFEVTVEASTQHGATARRTWGVEVK